MAHGNLVWEYYQKLLRGDWAQLKIPEWLVTSHETITNAQLNVKIVKDYIIYHDCGKHLCETHDEKGVHYPDHANVSANYCLENGGDPLVANLIRNDMFFHTCTAQELEDSTLSVQELATLLMASLAEIHANAQMFGGLESQSFKIKYKQIDRRGKAFFKKHLDNSYKGYIYCFTRKDFSPSQQTVQLSHACIEAQKRFSPDRHPSIVALATKSEAKLKQVIQECIDNGIDFVIFRDTIHRNEITAVATEPLYDEKREVFKRYQLL